MKADLNSYPLNIYNEETSKLLLAEVDKGLEDGLPLFDTVSVGIKGKKVRKCLGDLIREQTMRVNNGSSSILEEAQLNIMAVASITDYLVHSESGSWVTIVKSLVSAASAFDIVVGLCEKYDRILVIYYVAFLLTIYHSDISTKDIVMNLITEALSEDSEGRMIFSSRKLPLLFSNVPDKTIEDNLKNRLDFLIERARSDEDLFDHYIKWRIDNNAES